VLAANYLFNWYVTRRRPKIKSRHKCGAGESEARGLTHSGRHASNHCDICAPTV
jgi:hypothetical protein